jgi:hypothetical protein
MERLVDLLDDIDGDPDLEPECEDEDAHLTRSLPSIGGNPSSKYGPRA